MALYGRTCTLVGVKDSKKITIDGGMRNDGTDGFRVSFNIQKSGVAINTAEIKIYNLNKDTLEFFSTKGVQIEFSAGYIDNKVLIFKGEIVSVLTEKQAPDHITTINSSSGLTSTKSSFSNTVINKDESVADAVKKLLKDITNLETGFVDKIPECKKWIRSQTISGNTFDILDRLGTECGFTINVDDDKVEIHKHDYEPKGKNVIILNSSTGLIGIPSSTEIGVDFQALLNPNLVPNKGVQIESKSYSLGVSNAGFYDRKLFKDGRYGILTTNFIGDTNGSDWYAKCKTRYWGGVMKWKH